MAVLLIALLLDMDFHEGRFKSDREDPLRTHASIPIEVSFSLCVIDRLDTVGSGNRSVE